MKILRNVTYGRQSDHAMDRRAALKLFMTGVASTLTSCGRPPEEVVPYVQMPERETPGLPLRFASALPLAGYGRGVIVTSVEGRPIKVDGNPRHPASLGSTDVYGEAAVLSLAALAAWVSIVQFRLDRGGKVVAVMAVPACLFLLDWAVKKTLNKPMQTR